MKKKGNFWWLELAKIFKQNMGEYHVSDWKAQGI